MTTHQNYYGKMNSPEKEVEKITTQYKADQMIEEWNRKVKGHEFAAACETKKAENYKQRIALLQSKYETLKKKN